MCGILGLFTPGRKPDTDTLERMNSCQTHRGPDEKGTYVSGSLGLAHRRLSIIDLETGTQPIYNEDESVVVIFNGEIYNYASLRESLRSAGHQFTTDSDTEVLVHLYEEHGVDFVDRLEGMFAFALWDTDRERLVLARDPMGIKPLVLLESDGDVGFASEIPALFESDLDLGGIDREAIAQYFAFGYIPAPNTAFEHVSKLRPGERAVISDDGIERERYYTPDITPSDPGIERASTELRDRVETAIEKRLMSDVDLGAFLSGGIDSSIIVGMMSELRDEPVQTYTVGFQQDLFDESWAANEVAEFHGTDHHEFTLSADDVRQLVPTVLEQLGEPFGDPSLLPSYVVARETRRNVKVALSGDGADELFAGYDKYRVESLSKYYRALPEEIRKYAVEPVVNSLPASRGNPIGDAIYKGQWFVNRSSRSAVPDRHFDLMRVHDDVPDPLFESVSPAAVGQRTVREHHASLPQSLHDRESLTRIQAVDSRLSLPNQMLPKVDKASMYNSLEVRVPFLDTDVVECAMGLPTTYKITRNQRKRLLKEAFDDVLPDSILERNKQGFDMPIGEWFKGSLAQEFRDTVHAVDVGIIDDEEVMAVYDEHTEGRHDHSRFLWTIYVFKQWAKRMQDRGAL